MKTFNLKSMGCKSNQLEGFLIEQNLIKNNWEKTSLEKAAFFILNSCTVTHKSDNEAFNILQKVKRGNPNIKTVLTGCIAQIEKENLLQDPFIDFVVGNDEKLELAEILNSKNSFSVKNIFELKDFHKILLNDTTKTRASLKIQDGCDNRCSYCIIPFARGKNRSADLDFILEQIKIYEKAEFKEIMLTGIHIGQWECGSRSEPVSACGMQAGQGELNDSDVRVCCTNSTGAIDKNKNLLYLLQNIEEKTNIKRFRLGSLNPLEINDEMLKFLKNSQKFCPHFHLSIQSMCDKTLKSMNRHYTVNQTLELIEKINQTFDTPFIGSDIIAGFAGESQEDFEITVENLKKSKLTQIHTFPYSVRKGTAAEEFENQIDLKTKNKRASIIKQISAQKHEEFLQKNIGTIQEVLIEKNLDKKTGFFKGMTRNYINVLLDPKKYNFEKNSIHKIKIEKEHLILK